jgi:hypothetical protein
MMLPRGWWTVPAVAIVGMFAILAGVWWAWIPFVVFILGFMAWQFYEVFVLDRRRLAELERRTAEALAEYERRPRRG